MEEVVAGAGSTNVSVNPHDQPGNVMYTLPGDSGVPWQPQPGYYWSTRSHGDGMGDMVDWILNKDPNYGDNSYGQHSFDHNPGSSSSTFYEDDFNRNNFPDRREHPHKKKRYLRRKLY